DNRFANNTGWALLVYSSSASGHSGTRLPTITSPVARKRTIRRPIPTCGTVAILPEATSGPTIGAPTNAADRGRTSATGPTGSATLHTRSRFAGRIGIL